MGFTEASLWLKSLFLLLLINAPNLPANLYPSLLSTFESAEIFVQN